MHYLRFSSILTLDSKPYVEGSCISDPCWFVFPPHQVRYILILVLLGMRSPARQGKKSSSTILLPTPVSDPFFLFFRSFVLLWVIASNIVAKNIVATTQTHAPVTVMCDPKAVRDTWVTFSINLAD